MINRMVDGDNGGDDHDHSRDSDEATERLTYLPMRRVILYIISRALFL
jgi:hypothetical protein